MGIRGKLLAVLLAIGLLPMALVGLIAYSSARSELDTEARDAQE